MVTQIFEIPQETWILFIQYNTYGADMYLKKKPIIIVVRTRVFFYILFHFQFLFVIIS